MSLNKTSILASLARSWRSHRIFWITLVIPTLLSTLWTLGDFSTVYFVSSGAPARTTDVLAIYSFTQAFNFGHPELGAAAMMSALPLVIPLIILLMRRLHRTGLQL